MISAYKINKKFAGSHALNDISFDIAKGEIVGFLGKNGAGKTTLMRILTTYLPMTSGRVTVFGIDSKKNPMAIKRRLGYLPENLPVYQDMSVDRYIRFAAQLKDIPPKQHRAQIDRVLDICRLTAVAKKQISILSKGYKQRVGIAQAIIDEPELLILDEPTNGLDPVQIMQVREIIRDLERKRTVLLSTHILSEIEHLADRVIIIKDGKKVSDGTLQGLLAFEGETKEIRLEVSGQKQYIEDAVNKTKGTKLSGMVLKENRYIVTLEVSAQIKDYNELLQNILKVRANIIGIMEVQPDLEQAFLKLNT